MQFMNTMIWCLPYKYTVFIWLYRYRLVFLCSDAIGKNVVHQLSVTLEEMYNGSTRKLGLQKNVICEKCDGMLIFILVILHYCFGTCVVTMKMVSKNPLPRIIWLISVKQCTLARTALIQVIALRIKFKHCKYMPGKVPVSTQKQYSVEIGNSCKM